MNSSFPNRWSFSYLKFTKYVTNIIDEPKYKYGQQEQVKVKNHNRSTALERSVLKYVLVPADKAAKNVVVVWRHNYINTLKQDHGGTEAYKV